MNDSFFPFIKILSIALRYWYFAHFPEKKLKPNYRDGMISLTTNAVWKLFTESGCSPDYTGFPRTSKDPPPQFLSSIISSLDVWFNGHTCFLHGIIKYYLSLGLWSWLSFKEKLSQLLLCNLGSYFKNLMLRTLKEY